MMLKKLLSSFTETANNRVNSSMYGPFIISWVLWNWKSIYVTFFVDQEKIFELTHKLKIEYILSEYRWLPWFFGVWTFSKLFILPALSAFFIVFCLSKVECLFFRQTLRNQYAEKKERNKQENDFLSETQETLKTKQEVLKTKSENIEIEKKLEKSMTDEEKWDEEYENVKSDLQFNSAMSTLQNVLYKRGGFAGDENSDNIAYLDVNGLSGESEHGNRYISGNVKGKYFLKKYMKDLEKALAF